MSGYISRLARGSAAAAETRPLVLEVGHEDADAVLDALSPETGRALIEALYDEPSTPSEVADRVGTSVQNVHYHLGKLESAGLIEPIDTRYSEKGNEMTVHGPTSDPIVLVGNGSDDAERVVADLVGGVGLLALASLVVQFVVETLVPTPGDSASVLGPASRDLPASADPTLLERVVFGVVEPGVLFFVGGLAVLAGVAYVRYRG